MQLDSLINILKNGYVVNIDYPEPSQTLVPPNKYMIHAAILITQLAQDNQKLMTALQQWQGVASLAHQNCEQLTQELQNALDSKRQSEGNTAGNLPESGRECNANSDSGPVSGVSDPVPPV